MNEVLSNDQQSQLNALYERMEPEGLYPLWEKLAALVLPQPNSPAKVHKWSYDKARDYLMRAGDLIMTGTPAGVGAVVKGDVLEGKIEGVGTVRTKII